MPSFYSFTNCHVSDLSFQRGDQFSLYTHQELENTYWAISAAQPPFLHAGLPDQCLTLSNNVLSALSCFHTHSGTLNLSRHYPEELCVRMQTSKAFGTDIKLTKYPPSSLTRRLCNVPLSPRMDGRRSFTVSKWLLATLLSCV